MVWAYWRRLWRFAARGEWPKEPWDVPVWGLAVPFRLWHREVRFDGTTFAEYYSRGASALVRAVLPLRFIYLFVLWLWPLVALVRALLRPGRLRAYLKGALLRPDLALWYPKADFSEREWQWARPDHALGMYYAHLWAARQPAFFALDDKRHFVDVCRKHGLPLPPTFDTPAAALQSGLDQFIVKDPEDDLGYGVRAVSRSELSSLKDPDDLILQARLRNHPSLLASFPDDAPLSSLRVITMKDPDTGALTVSRCAIRIGRSGSAVDNTAQGGIWSRIELESGRICDGVTKKSFGRTQRGVPLRYREHPDTGRGFVGLLVPWFEEGKRRALDAHRRLAPDALTLGWDLALAESGPVFLEVNVWAACYDYDPETDAFTPACRQIVAHPTMP